jgi:cobalt ECF transporter T component CbiQ
MKNPGLPDWYISSADLGPKQIPREPRTLVRPLRKTLARMTEALGRELAAKERPESWLTGIEPRAKIIGVLILIFGATFLRELPQLAAFLAITVILVFAGRISIKRLAILWMGVPLFSLAIVLPATLNIVTEGNAVLTLWRIGPGVTLGPWSLPEAITITQNGLIVAGRFLLRSTACVSLSLLLIMTTEPALLINALRRLGMPKVFGMVLSMAERYLSALLRAGEEIHLAKLSRTISQGTVRREERWVAAGIGILFRRAYALGLEVTNAMLARGYDGDLQVGRVARLRLVDLGWPAATAALIALLILSEHLF